MKANVGNADRVFRIVLGIALLAMFVLAEGTLKYVGLIGIVPLVTGLFRFCPIYAVLGLRTCPTDAR
ncbi:MAG: DUF2892 domain-containing protein [Burkholderiales bacterium]